jgi:hypothetical protein
MAYLGIDDIALSPAVAFVNFLTAFSARIGLDNVARS